MAGIGSQETNCFGFYSTFQIRHKRREKGKDLLAMASRSTISYPPPPLGSGCN